MSSRVVRERHGDKTGRSYPTYDIRQLVALRLQEKELAKEMDGLNIVAHTSSSAAGGAGGAADGVKKYNKSSFFDEISCDVLDRAAGVEGVSQDLICQYEQCFDRMNSC